MGTHISNTFPLKHRMIFFNKPEIDFNEKQRIGQYYILFFYIIYIHIFLYPQQSRRSNTISCCNFGSTRSIGGLTTSPLGGSARTILGESSIHGSNLRGGIFTDIDWLVVSTHFKNISQIGSFPQIGLKIKDIWNHHLVLVQNERLFWWNLVTSMK